jgi:heme a synthase
MAGHPPPVEMSSQPTTKPPLALSRYAKAVVAAAFLVIVAGAHTTTAGAGMAFPDWPLSNGSLNPEGWLTDLMMFLEHSHRLIAGTVAALIGVLAFWTTIQRGSVPAGSVALAWWAFGGVLAQALLGGLRVVLDPQGVCHFPPTHCRSGHAPPWRRACHPYFSAGFPDRFMDARCSQ